MKTQALIKTNPYLKDAGNRKRLVQRSVRTSCGVEGILEKIGEIQFFNIPSRGKKKIHEHMTK